MSVLLPGADALRRFLESKLRSEWQHLGRRLPPALEDADWQLELRLDEGGLGADSLDRMALAAAVSETCCLPDAGNEDRLLVERTFGGWIEVLQEAWKHSLKRLIFLTSGSTGTAKRCEHSYSTLIDEARFFADVYAGRQRVISLVPAHHIYGFLFTVLLPEALGVPVLNLGRSGSASRIEPGDLVIGFPTRWAALSRSGAQFPPNVQGTTSTALCDPRVIANLRAAGIAGMVEIYGSTETAGVGWRDSPEKEYALLPRWKRIDAQTLCGSNEEDGTPCVMSDHLIWSHGQSFRIGNRIDGAVQVGGINVFPEAIARRLEEHPAIAKAQVRFSSSDQRLKAFLILNDASAAEDMLVPEIEAWMEKTLSSHERPRQFAFGTEMPINELGKATGW